MSSLIPMNLCSAKISGNKNFITEHWFPKPKYDIPFERIPSRVIPICFYLQISKKQENLLAKRRLQAARSSKVK